MAPPPISASRRGAMGNPALSIASDVSHGRDALSLLSSIHYHLSAPHSFLISLAIAANPVHHY